MLPEYSAKEWVLVYYEENTKSSRPEQYWKAYGHELYQNYSQKIRINKDVKQIAVTAIGDAKTDEERIANLLAHCRKNLHNTNTEEIMERQRGSSKENRTTVDTLKQGSGTPQEIAYAFAALATAAGFEARVARLSDRGTFFFNPDVPSAYLLNAFDIAVKMNGNGNFMTLPAAIFLLGCSPGARKAYLRVPGMAVAYPIQSHDCRGARCGHSGCSHGDQCTHPETASADLRPDQRSHSSG
ncbi:MAG TPA: transglutaminase domain-containing protein [Bryobacteraceae bacterium]|nr:transglutaminase domain-containing protein [Bryobacteraceae bacterium]